MPPSARTRVGAGELVARFCVAFARPPRRRRASAPLSLSPSQDLHLRTGRADSSRCILPRHRTSGGDRLSALPPPPPEPSSRWESLDMSTRGRRLAALVRHGHFPRPEGVASGHLPLPLSPEGRGHARDAGLQIARTPSILLPLEEHQRPGCVGPLGCLVLRTIDWIPSLEAGDAFPTSVCRSRAQRARWTPGDEPPIASMAASPQCPKGPRTGCASSSRTAAASDTPPS